MEVKDTKPQIIIIIIKRVKKKRCDNNVKT